MCAAETQSVSDSLVACIVLCVEYRALGPTTTVSGIRVELYALGWVAESWEIIVGMFS